MGPISGVSSDDEVRVQKLVQDTAKRDGEAAIALIDQATPPPIGPVLAKSAPGSGRS